MIKAKATLEGDRPLYVFGLSALNLERLRAGRPIVIQLESIGGVGEVYITYGETEADIARELSDLVGPRTIVTGLDKMGH
jgi:hypothetical protein